MCENKELKDKQLEKVVGGNGPVSGRVSCYVPKHPGYVNPKLEIDCHECAHWNGAEGPCELGLE